MKQNRRTFNHGELADYMQFHVDGQPIFDRSFLDMWLNGKQYHADTYKEAAWEKLEKVMQAENTRALLMQQIHDRVKSLFHLEGIVEEILRVARHTIEKT